MWGWDIYPKQGECNEALTVNDHLVESTGNNTGGRLNEHANDQNYEGVTDVTEGDKNNGVDDNVTEDKDENNEDNEERQSQSFVVGKEFPDEQRVHIRQHLLLRLTPPPLIKS